MKISNPAKDATFFMILNQVVEILFFFIIPSLIIYTIYNKTPSELTINTVKHWFLENTRHHKYLLILGYILTIFARYLIVNHYIKKYKIPLKFSFSNFKKILPIIVVMVIFDVLVVPMLENEPYRLQMLAEYKYHAKIGTGILGYGLEIVYYVLEGFWIAVAFYIGSCVNKWFGLAIVLIFWASVHILNSLPCLITAIVYVFIFEFTRRRAENNLLSIVMVWMILMLV
jgi:hypothetical protein